MRGRNRWEGVEILEGLGIINRGHHDVEGVI